MPSRSFSRGQTPAARDWTSALLTDLIHHIKHTPKNSRPTDEGGVRAVPLHRATRRSPDGWRTSGTGAIRQRGKAGGDDAA
jgi:hypothetical protein